MKYENASEILPEELLKEVQKYAAGKLLYIPSGEDKKAWGETSGVRNQLLRRNLMIRNKYANGMTVSELADEYFLSLDSIKKIIYSKKTDDYLTYFPTLQSAVKYAGAGMLEEWIHCYLLFTQRAYPVFSELLTEDLRYFGVVKFPLRLIQSEAIGPEDSLGVDNYGEGERDDPAAHPPLLVQYEERQFHCVVETAFFAALKQRKVNAYPTIIILKSNADYKRFMKYYGTVLFFVDSV